MLQWFFIWVLTFALFSISIAISWDCLMFSISSLISLIILVTFILYSSLVPNLSLHSIY